MPDHLQPALSDSPATGGCIQHAALHRCSLPLLADLAQGYRVDSPAAVLWHDSGSVPAHVCHLPVSLHHDQLLVCCGGAGVPGSRAQLHRRVSERLEPQRGAWCRCRCSVVGDVLLPSAPPQQAAGRNSSSSVGWCIAGGQATSCPRLSPDCLPACPCGFSINLVSLSVVTAWWMIAAAVALVLTVLAAGAAPLFQLLLVVLSGNKPRRTSSPFFFFCIHLCRCGALRCSATVLEWWRPAGSSARSSWAWRRLWWWQQTYP